jgi:hypothetical protein
VYRDSFLNQIYRQNEVVYLNPGQSIDGHYYANLGCGHDREFRVAYRCRGGIYAATNYTFGREVSLAGIRNAPRIVNLGTIGLGGRCR